MLLFQPILSVSNVCEGRNCLNGEAVSSMVQLVVEKGKSGCVECMKQAFKKKSSGSKNKYKGIHGQGAQGSKVSKDQSMIDSSIPLKSGKSSPPNSLVYKNDKLNLQKDQGKPGDRYKDFTGDLEFEEDKDSAAGEMTLERKLKDFQLIERSIANVGCHSTTKEKCKGKKPKKPSFGEKYPRGLPMRHLHLEMDPFPMLRQQEFFRLVQILRAFLMNGSVGC